LGRMMGYARVSTSDQDVQFTMERYGVPDVRSRIFSAIRVRAYTARPGLEACIRH